MSNTNGIIIDFDLASTTIIEVYPFIKTGTPRKPSANISSIDFSSGRGVSGVNLRWHHPTEFKGLPKNQKDELCA